MTTRLRFFSLFLLFFVFFAASCGSAGRVREMPLPSAMPPAPPEPPPSALPSAEGGGPVSEQTGEAPAPPSGGVVDEIRRLTESGILASMRQALELIRDRGLGASEFGRVMNAVNAALIGKIYPADAARLPAPDPPQSHTYARILREADRGIYTPPPASSTDYLEYTLPFLALFNEKAPERLLPALADLQKAQSLRPDSVLAPYFAGIVYERAGRLDEASAAYTRAWAIAPECYPAALGLARVMELSGRETDARLLLLDLANRFPGNIAITRGLAVAWYRSGNWARAEPAIAEVLRQDSRDGECILMRAHILVEQGQYTQAQAPLDLYATFNPNNRLYLLLRARVQAEGYRSRESALNYLRTLLRVFPGDEEASAYAARLLMESPRSEDKAEGRELYRRLLGAADPSPTVLSLGLQDAISRENWREAQGYLNRLLGKRRSTQDLFNAYLVERGLGNGERALSFARELYERDASNDEGIAAYISALIDMGRQEEAARMIESRLAALSGGIAKSRYYYLRSRLQTGEDAALADLRESLFEDPRNLNALIAMFEIYHQRRDERRAVYYLRQSLALAPDNPRLKRYEGEYGLR